MEIEAAQERDLSAVRQLLERQHLPLEGVDDHVEAMLVARDGERVVGAAAVELYADGALLRSVVVDPAVQGQRLGHRLTEAALKTAERRGARTVFLLTTTAEDFFPRFGFERIARDQVPASVQASVEFRSACPSSAVVMRKHLAKTVLFACVHNAGRSQMAAALFNALADPSQARALSAGTRPAERVHPEVVAVLQENGIDLAAARPRLLTPELAAGAHLLITMACGDECPYVPGLQRDDWPLEDPKGKPPEQVRAIRDEIHRRVRDLIARERWAPSNP